MSRTGTALVVLLAALVHLLACAHGPTPTGVSRADAILSAPVSCGQPAGSTEDRAVQQSDPTGGDPSHCCGIDEPTVQPPRDIAPAAAAVPHAVPAERAAAPLLAVRAALLPDPERDAIPQGQSQARLGVWRT
ncbi:hypothetical protein [Streptomyces sp. STR69]|uniref:hypothetical protein n=1 Tax=Streptomyces sp. STR69 TaxID=1796942 RepID=UPI0021C8D40D|nr:hypothetical protein [Streptomyces sp. STR69]